MGAIRDAWERPALGFRPSRRWLLCPEGEAAVGLLVLAALLQSEKQRRATMQVEFFLLPTYLAP